jgi:membrane protein
VRDRLALDGKKAGGYFNQQIVEPIQGKQSAGLPAFNAGYPYAGDGRKQVDNTTNILRLMLLLSLAIGVVLTRTLLQEAYPLATVSFLLTASKPVPEEEENEKKE